MKKQFHGTVALLLATTIWGSAFIAQSVGMDYIGPFTFQAIRCALACAFLFPLSFLLSKEKKAFFSKWRDPHLWKTGSVCGLALFAAAGLQQVGLLYTAPGKAGFLTAMYIVLVPILGIFLKKAPPLSAWIGVVLAVIGLYLLSCAGVTQINIGDWMLLGCAFGFSVQITLIDQMAAELDGIRLNFVQSLVCALLSAVMSIFTEQPNVSSILACWLPLGYAGILSMGVAYSLQIVGQKALPPAPAALLMSLESVFAALFGWLLLKQTMTLQEIGGCCFVFAAVILSQIPTKKAAC